MRKLLLILIMAVSLSGCGQSGLSDREREAKYNEYIKMVQDNKGAESQDIPFQYKMEATKTKGGEYEYTVTLDQPRIAMYDIEVIIVDSTKLNSDNMMPNLGIIDDEDAVYHMIPFQVDTKRGFHKGIQLNGYTNKESFTLHVLVTWKDYAKLNTSKAFFTFTNPKQAKQSKDQLPATPSEDSETGDDES